jgi:two-component system, NtrC family, sensor histidine kinase KinB
MKRSLRTRFLLGMIFLFVIILILSVFSGYFMNKLSARTGAILKENYLSVVYAREMSQSIMTIDQSLTTGFLEKRRADSSTVLKELDMISKSLLDEKNNLTEPGEDKLVSDIGFDFDGYQRSVISMITSSTSDNLLKIQATGSDLYLKLQLLSELNGKAIEQKTEDAKLTAKSGLTRMTILATLCFLVGMSFIFSFASYFSQRFFQLYKGIKDTVASDFNNSLFLDGNDEFNEISVVFNEMVEKLKKNHLKMSVSLHDNQVNKAISADLGELKKTLSQMKVFEERVAALIAGIEEK